MLGLEALSCLHTTAASFEKICSLHIVPQALFIQTSNRPLIWDVPFTSRMSPWVQFPALATSLSWHTTLAARLQVEAAPDTIGQADREGSVPLHAKPEIEVMRLIVPPKMPLATVMAPVKARNASHKASHMIHFLLP